MNTRSRSSVEVYFDWAVRFVITTVVLSIIKYAWLFDELIKPTPANGKFYLLLGWVLFITGTSIALQIVFCFLFYRGSEVKSLNPTMRAVFNLWILASGESFALAFFAWSHNPLMWFSVLFEVPIAWACVYLLYSHRESWKNKSS